MTETAKPMGVRHVVRSTDLAAPRLVQHRHHLIHVAFNNRIISSEKKIDDRSVRALPGRTVGRSMILPAGCEMWGWTIGEVDFLGLELHSETFTRAIDDAGHRGSVELQPRIQLDDPVLWHLACALRADMTTGRPGGQLFRDGIEMLISSHLITGHFGTPTRGSPAAGALSIVQFRRVSAFLSENLHRDLSLAEMAGVLGLSTFHFARAFKAAAGVSPYKFLLEERLSTARKLLEATSLSVGEVGQSTGFQTLTGFGTAFRRRWGISPTQYRQSVRG